ncbi:hypothetical protein V6N13_018385 [Hibiscus sabdariffa]|uniref:Uncharacterized protein n=1 Tax=Hibiscus sabdariffa TaxID=183260 RepID=A0ABR2ENW0_9ROSI
MESTMQNLAVKKKTEDLLKRRQQWRANVAILEVRVSCSFLADIFVHAKIVQLFLIVAPFVVQQRKLL